MNSRPSELTIFHHVSQSTNPITHTYLHKPPRKMKWPSTITRLTAHFTCSVMSDLVISKLRKNMVIHNTEWTIFLTSLLRPGVIKQHKPNPNHFRTTAPRAVFLCCYSDCPVNDIQMAQATWVMWVSLKNTDSLSEWNVNEIISNLPEVKMTQRCYSMLEIVPSIVKNSQVYIDLSPRPSPSHC